MREALATDADPTGGPHSSAPPDGAVTASAEVTSTL
jgi:hypothetical protein